MKLSIKRAVPGFNLEIRDNVPTVGQGAFVVCAESTSDGKTYEIYLNKSGEAEGLPMRRNVDTTYTSSVDKKIISMAQDIFKSVMA